ncbi:MAG: lamin tail domain-containing protein [Bacteroidota bacterium]
MRVSFFLFLWLLSTGISAQLLDDFSDGNLSQNPAWSGETSLFQVSNDFRLQSNGLSQSDNIHLSTANSRLENTEWRFDLSYAFAPSSTNQIRIYLTSDNSDLEGSLNGYFIQIGEGQSADSYDLFRQDGTTTTQLIDGIPGTAGSGIDATVKVVRDLVGNWLLEVDSGRTGIFVPQGSILDDTYSNTNFFGLWVKHTSGRAKSYFFDNFYIGDPIVDLEPPRLDSLAFLSATELHIQFTEGLMQSTAEESSNYVLLPTAQSPILAQQMANGTSVVTLTFGMPLIEGNSYQLVVNGISDLAGNVMTEADTLSFLFDLPDTAEFKEVLIHELMPDPSPSAGLPEVEYVELYNRSNKQLELEGWRLTNGPSSGVLPAFKLMPDAYVILVKSSEVFQFLSFGDVIGLESMPTLVNSADEIGLRSAEGRLIDSVEYERSWYQDDTKDDGGYALELIWPEQFSCPPQTNWGAAVNNGTPGAQNSRYDPSPDTTAPSLFEAQAITNLVVRLCFDKSMQEGSLMQTTSYVLNPSLGSPIEVEIEDEDVQCIQLTWGESLAAGTVYTLSVNQLQDCSGNALPPTEVAVAIGLAANPHDVVITELLPDVSPAVSLPEAEFIELHNRTSKVLDLSLFSLSDGTTTASWGKRVMFPGEYLIACKEEDASALASFGKVLPLPDWPSLINSGDSVFLRDNNQQLIDAVRYSDDWFKDPEKANGGWTLERIDPDFVACDHPDNWIASVSQDGGTPGSPNSVLGAFVDEQVPEFEKWELLDLQRIRLVFNEPMDQSALGQTSHYLLQPSIGMPISAEVSNGDPTAVVLSFDSPLDSSIVYTLAMDSLSDCSKNMFQLTLPIGVALSPQAFDIIFTEVFPDVEPIVGLPDVEFMEFYVRGDQIIDLEGCQLTDGTTNLVFGPTALFPDTYYILCAERHADLYASYGELIPVSSSVPSLNNLSDSLILTDPEGRLIDYLFYSAVWYQDIEKLQGGWTLERIDTDAVDCNHEDNWAASVHFWGGTPGKPNSVNGTFVDEQSPEVVGITVSSPSEIILEFSEQMDFVILEDIQHYSLDHTIGQPVLAIPSSPYPRQLHLFFDTEMMPGLIYELSLSGLQDCSGNILETVLPLGVPEKAEEGDLLINEILFNPYPGANDFVELANVSNKVLNLEELGIGERDPATGEIFNTDQIALKSQLFLPGGLICLSNNVDIQRQTYLPPADATFFQMIGFPSYDDARGECVIFRLEDTLLLDVLAYEDDFHFATLSDDEGVSLERLSLSRPTQDPDNWHSAASTVGYATPGYENSQRLQLDNPTEEVSVTPQTFSPNQDGQDDVLAINYQFDFPGGNARISILDSRGRLVKILHQNILLNTGVGTFFWDGTDARQGRAPIGTYIVLFEVVDTSAGIKKVFRQVCVLADQLSSG